MTEAAERLTTRGAVRIGVLALQGDFAAHAAALERAGAEACEVRRADQLASLDGLVLPGGESTTLILLLRAFGLWEPVRAFAAAGRPVFGTCAGLILLAEEVANPSQEAFGLLPLRVERNAYGRQVDSFVVRGRVQVPVDLAGEGGRTFETDLVFIRAPRITEVRDGVEVWAQHAGSPILVRRGNLLGASFHPELASDHRVIRLFVTMAEQARAARLAGAAVAASGFDASHR
jgi:5'-phosphate synthase pdxT subunit